MTKMGQIRGWIYIITNEAMPGLIKIGFSTKDPVLRASELDNTGIPYPYIVVYDALVMDPRTTEQNIHRLFQDRLEEKEWFRCSIESAISEIKSHLSEKIILEKFHVSMGEISAGRFRDNRICNIYECSNPSYKENDGFWYCEMHWKMLRPE